MSNTGHKNNKMYDGLTIVEWLRPCVSAECEFYGVPEPTDKQIAVVIRSMRLQSLIMYAAAYDFSELGKPDTPQELWPLQLSIGRFFRDAPESTLEQK